MDDTTPQAPKPEVAPGNKKHRKARIMYAVAAVLLVGILSLAGWSYYDSSAKIHDQKILIDDLRERLERLGGEAADDPDSAGDGSDVAGCAGGSAYSADVGNFAITVSDPNVIIRSLDANFEGGPMTNLSVGRCVEDGTNVVDNYLVYSVDILAHPAANAATLRANFESEWGSPLTADATIMIDGVSAQTYLGEGLFSTKVVYFDHGGIGYQIELPDRNSTSEAVLTDVVSDWSFTP